MKSLIIPLLFLCLSVNAQQLTGNIVRITDGDTVVLLDDTNTQHKIRLYGIDAPEKGQDYGTKAKEYLSRLIAGKRVTVETKGKDIYRRTLGIIYLGDVNINSKMIEAGYAWRYKPSNKEPATDKHNQQLQEKAKRRKSGLWKDEKAVEPKQWRKDKKDGRKNVKRH